MLFFLIFSLIAINYMCLAIILLPIIVPVFLPHYYPIDRLQHLHPLLLSLLLVVLVLLDLICVRLEPLIDLPLLWLCLGYWNDLFPGHIALAALYDAHSLSDLLVICEPLILFVFDMPVDAHVGLHLPLC